MSKYRASRSISPGTRLSRSTMALAIAGGLAALITAPLAFADERADPVAHAISSAFAASSVDTTTLQPTLPRALFSQHWTQRPATTAAPAAAPAASTTASVPADATDASAWIDEEFQADWGLEVINAHHAYARGLTGAGVRLGLLDSGTAFDHPEFAGKDHRGLTMAQVLADGSLCSDGTILGGPDACFYSVGDQSSIDGEYWDPELAALFPNPANDYLWGNTFYTFSNHGTHVAGTIAANRDGSGMHGVAFGADLSSARLFNDSLAIVDIACILFNECSTIGTSADASAFVGMYDQAIAQGVKAMNHSWGYTYYAYTPEVAELYHEALMDNPRIAGILTTMAEASRQSGMIQVLSAGNTNVVIATPEQSPEPTAPATLPSIFPDIEQYWVSVVNLNDQLELSNRSMKCGISAQWCIAAPGSVITSTVLDGGDELVGGWVIDDAGNLRYEFEDRTGIPAYADMSGTSMAAPHVTGALGLLFERFPYLTGAQVRDVMLTTATDLGEEGVDEIYGWGLLNLEKAIEGYGQLRVDTTVDMSVAAGGRKVWEGNAWDDWTNDIGGPGRLTKSGAGWLRLSGDNSFAGATVAQGLLEFDGDNALTGDVRVDGGTLLVNGRLDGSALTVAGGLAVINGTVAGAATRVEAGGTLGGSGTLGDTWVAGTIAPGSSIGTLTIDGDYTQAASARLVAEILPPDQADLLRVTGSANLLGGTLVASSLGDGYTIGQQYRILSAEGGITGGFSSIDSSGLSPFLALSLLQSANAVDVDVIRGAALASAATSGNQFATAAALDALPLSQVLLQPLTRLDVAQARGAFDQLSGEAHASARQVLLEGSRLVRDAALARASAGHGGFLAQHDADAATGAWVQVQHQGGSIAGDGNATRVQYSGNGALVGVDHQFEGGWRVGAYGGTGETDFNLRGRASKGETSSRHAGVYVGQAWGGFGVRAGYAQSWNRVDVDRTLAFPGFAGTVGTRYDADSKQAFVDAGYRFGNEAWELEPYLQYAHVELDSDGFREQGSIAALQGRAGEARAELATAGLRFGANLRGSGQEQTWLSLRGNLGYRHAGGDQRRTAQLSLDGSNWFGVSSPVIGSSALLAEIGLAARTSSNSVLELGYTSVDADEARDHGVNARFSVRF